MPLYRVTLENSSMSKEIQKIDIHIEAKNEEEAEKKASLQYSKQMSGGGTIINRKVTRIDWMLAL